MTIGASDGTSAASSIAGATWWTVAAWGLAASVTCGIIACMWGVPLSLTDNLVLMLEAQRKTLAEGLYEWTHARGLLRPLLGLQYKVLFELSHGQYYLAFQGFHAAMLALAVAFFVSMLRVRTVVDFAAFSIALMVLFGLHTIGNSIREQPILAVTCCALAMALAWADRPSRWRDALATGNLVVAMFYVEIGLLVWVVYVAAAFTRQRGISRTGLAMATAAVAGYFVVRFVILPAGLPPTFPRGTGFGFANREPRELEQMFGVRPWVLYGYNVMASTLSVLLSEPRAGIFQFTRGLVQDEVRPWMWINVVSSALMTSSTVWVLWTSRREWRRRQFSRDHALVVVAIAVLIANAVISYPYVRDVTMSPAGLCYALAAFPVMRSLMARLPARGAATRMLLITLGLVLSLGWSSRVIALTYSVRETAFRGRNDWATAEQWLERVGALPGDERGRQLVQTLKREALGTEVPNPRLAQPEAELYLDPGH